jgi:hypothetical protein
MVSRDPVPPEFSRVVDAPAIVLAGGGREHFTASDSERAALAARLGVVALLSLEAALDLRVWRGCGLEVEGVLRARVVQTCVVSLEPLESVIEALILAQYLPAAMVPDDSPEAAEAVFDPSAADPPELIPEGGRLDFGELVTQHLAIAIDPYPRRAGAEFASHLDRASSPEQGPFAKLAALKRPPKE